VQAFLEIGAEIAGYRVESFIGRGGMAVVYRAKDLRLGRKVALKLLAPELSANERFRQRFIRESRLAASIDHPNIIPIYEAGEAEEHLYIVMRYVEGSDLHTLLENDGPLDEPHILSFFAQLGGALDAAHTSGLVHRDVKPGNIMIASGAGPEDLNHVYLTDFGLTKRSSSLSGFTTTGHFIGTIDYVAPEQISGKAVDGRTDIYALGCVLYQCLTGTLPYHRDDDAALLWAHLVEPPPSVTSIRAELPPGLDDVIGKAMAKDPDDRYDTCRVMVMALHAELGGGGSGIIRPPSMRAPQQRVPETAEPTGEAAAAAAQPDGAAAQPDAPAPAVPPAQAEAPAAEAEVQPADAEPDAAEPAAYQQPAPWEQAEGYEDPAAWEYAEPYEGQTGWGEPDDAPPWDGPEQPVQQPRRRRRVPLAGIIAAAAILLVAVPVAAFLLLNRGGGRLDAHFAKSDLVPFSFDYPSTWKRAESGVTAVFSPRASDLAPLFTQKGTNGTWEATASALGSDPGNVVGLETFFTSAQYDAGNVDQLKDGLTSLLPTNVTFSSGLDKTPGRGYVADRIEGELTDPANGATKLRFVCYAVQLQQPDAKTVYLVFFSEPDGFDGRRDLFQRIVDSADFFA
jgi:protein kinase-like protein